MQCVASPCRFGSGPVSEGFDALACDVHLENVFVVVHARVFDGRVLVRERANVTAGLRARCCAVIAVVLFLSVNRKAELIAAHPRQDRY